jgi:hypothetical protein
LKFKETDYISLKSDLKNENVSEVSESLSLEERQVRKPILAQELEIVPVEDQKFIEKLVIKRN